MPDINDFYDNFTILLKLLIDEEVLIKSNIPILWEAIEAYNPSNTNILNKMIQMRIDFDLNHIVKKTKSGTHPVEKFDRKDPLIKRLKDKFPKININKILKMLIDEKHIEKQCKNNQCAMLYPALAFFIEYIQTHEVLYDNYHIIHLLENIKAALVDTINNSFDTFINSISLISAQFEHLLEYIYNDSSRIDAVRNSQRDKDPPEDAITIFRKILEYRTKNVSRNPQSNYQLASIMDIGTAIVFLIDIIKNIIILRYNSKKIIESEKMIIYEKYKKIKDVLDTIIIAFQEANKQHSKAVQNYSNKLGMSTSIINSNKKDIIANLKKTIALFPQHNENEPVPHWRKDMKGLNRP